MSISRAVHDITDEVRQAAEEPAAYAATPTGVDPEATRDAITRMIRDLETQMKQASRNLEFEQAAMLRDQIVGLRRELAGDALEDLPQWSDQSFGRRGRRPVRRRKEPSSPRRGS